MPACRGLRRCSTETGILERIEQNNWRRCIDEAEQQIDLLVWLMLREKTVNHVHRASARSEFFPHRLLKATARSPPCPHRKMAAIETGCCKAETLSHQVLKPFKLAVEVLDHVRIVI